MRKLGFLAILAMGIATGVATAGMTCKCTTGSMVVEFKDGKTIITCTGGGQVECTITQER